MEGVYAREPGFEKLDAKGRKAMEAYNRDYLDFLGKAKTERRAYADAHRAELAAERARIRR